jgi:hypothetical protein
LLSSFTISKIVLLIKLTESFAAKSPFINGVPEPDAIYNLLLSSVKVEGPAPNPIAILFEELPEKLHPAV